MNLSFSRILAFCSAYLLPLVCLTLKGQQTEKGHVREDSEHRLVVSFSLPEPKLRTVETEKGPGYIMMFQDAALSLRLGFPELPLVGGSVNLRGRRIKNISMVRRGSWQEIQGQYLPSKGNLTRDQRPSVLPYVWGAAYAENRWYPRNALAGTERFYLASDEGLRFRFSPVQVHPVKRKIRYARSWDLVLEFEPSESSESLAHSLHPSASKLFLNAKAARYSAVPEDGDLLVIADQPFVQTLMPWVQWKNRRGTRTHLADLSQTGNTAAQIKAYIQSFCQQYPISHVLLVGDIQHVPSHEKWGGVSDITYGELVGNDAYPEVFVGRLSVESVNELETILSRWLRYEQNPDLTNDWLDVTVGVASNEGPGDDNQMDWEHVRALSDQLTDYTYTQKLEFYDGTQGPPDAPGNPTAQELLAALNYGSGFVNYTGHGWEQGIATTGFSNTEAALLTNNGRTGMFVIVGCVTGAFHTTTCFSEKLTRTGSPASPHGAVAVFGATINQSWSPPMEAQDAIVDILTENEPNNVVMRTLGGLFYTGCMRMNDAYGIYGDEITETWILFGDPSMPYYTQTPYPLTAAHPASVAFGASSVNMSCSVEGALVCISQNHQILGRAYIQNGQASVSLDAFLSTDSLDVVVSAFNYIPYQGRIGVLPPAGPFVSVSNWQVHDHVWGNGNQKPEFNEMVHVAAQLTNLGQQTADSVTLALTITHPHATVTGGPFSVGMMTGGQSLNSGSVLQIYISNSVPDGTFIPFTLHCSWAGGQSQTQGHFMAAAPILHITHAELQQTSGNNNGISESGEDLLVTVHLANSGMADFVNAPVDLNLTHPHVAVVSATSQSVTVPANNLPLAASFALTAGAGAGADATGPLTITAGYGPYAASVSGGIHLNPGYDDFETGPFWCLPYNFGSQYPWHLDNTGSYNGQYALRSASIPDDGVSEVALTFEAQTADTLSFYLYVSCEESYDFFKVFLNNQLHQQWTGEVPWQRYAIPVTAGQHTVRWRYEKDYMISAGEDAALIDQIVLPKGSHNVALPYEEEEAWDVCLYPSPASDIIWIRISEDWMTENSTLELWDAQGRLLQVFNISSQVVVIPLSHFSPGLYTVRLTPGNGRSLGRRFTKM